MPYYTGTYDISTGLWNIGKPDQGLCSPSKGRFITYHTARRNTTRKSNAVAGIEGALALRINVPS
jgi:hypothetical protein